ncbi:hypothetical protein JVU11DRAFT_7492 [Chiua virens]|nr:hypothetical protein JVU11DRAFT_7492 [Chiua virens]
MSPLHRRRRQVLQQGLFNWRAHISRLSSAFEDLVRSVYDFAKALSGVVTFCLLLWALLEWAQYTSELHRQPTPWMTMKLFPLPSSNRTPRCHVNPSLYEPSDQQLAILQFLSGQVQHAKALSSLNTGLGLSLRKFVKAHRTVVPRVLAQRSLAEPPYLLQEGDMLTNVTELLDVSLLDFTFGSFVGRTLTLALDELGDFISEPVVSHGSAAHGQYQDAHLHAIYWRTTSNLILEYSAARPRARHLLQDLHVLYQQLSPIVSDVRDAASMDERSNIWWWQDIVHHSATSVEDRMRAFVTGLEISLDTVQRLVGYLDWITEQLAQTTLMDVLEIRSRTDFASCSMSLRELFAQSKPLTPKKLCFDLSDRWGTLSNRPERVNIMVPGSPTVRAGR